MLTSDFVKLSSFCHLFERNGILALFHTLKVQTIYINIEQNNQLVKFLKESIPFSCDNFDQEGVEVIEELIERNFLLPITKDDNSLLDEFRENYTGFVDITTLYLLLTDKCNFACKYCFVEGAIPSEHRFVKMTKQTARAAIDVFCKHAHICDEPQHKPTIIFYGGEPTFNWEVLKDVIYYIEKKIETNILPTRTELSLITNGTFLDIEKITFLKDHHINLAISLDGPKEHNDARIFVNGKKTFERVMETFYLLQQAELPFGVSCTVTPYNIDNLQEIARWFCKMGISSVGFNSLMDVPGRPPVDEDLIQKTAEAFTSCYEIFRENGVFEDRICRKVQTFTDQQVYPFDCSGYGGQLVVAPDGQIGPCHAYLGERKFFGPNVRAAADFDPRTDPIFIEWSKRSPLNMPTCLNCPALGICGGGCAKNAEIRHGSIWELDDRFCVHAKHTLKWMIWDLYKFSTSN